MPALNLPAYMRRSPRKSASAGRPGPEGLSAHGPFPGLDKVDEIAATAAALGYKHYVVPYLSASRFASVDEIRHTADVLQAIAELLKARVSRWAITITHTRWPSSRGNSPSSASLTQHLAYRRSLTPTGPAILAWWTCPS